MQIKPVLLFPPSDSFKIIVSLLSRNGICFSLLVKEFMHRDSVVRDKFIFFAYSNCAPSTPVLETFSEPAKSTRLSRDLLIEPLRNFYSKSKMKTV